MKNNRINCAQCPFDMPDRLCKREDGKAPASCPTKNKPQLIEKCREAFQDPDILEFARQASIQEGEGYGFKELGYNHVRPIKPRIEEVIEFARKMKYNRLGLVFCVGLRKEAAVVEKFFPARDLTLFPSSARSAVCPKRKSRFGMIRRFPSVSSNRCVTRFSRH